MEPNNEKLVEVFSGTLWQVGMVRSMLEDSDIPVYVKDEIIGTLNPWWTAPGGAGSISVFVSSNHFNNARAIVAEYEKSQQDNP